MPPIAMLWLYSIPLPLMILVIFVGVFAAAALIYFLIARLVAPRYLAVIKAISPVTLTPLAVVFGLLTGFLANNVWAHSENAQELVVREAGELARISRMADWRSRYIPQTFA